MSDLEEKKQYTVGSDSDHGVRGIVNLKGAAAGEGAELYGDIQTAEEYGYVERG